MMLQQEFLRTAGALEVDPEIVELDYVLGRFLDVLVDCLSASDHWIFKGGTSLRKCYFDDYRFSEDLDFTVAPVEKVVIERILGCGTDALTEYSDYEVRLVMPQHQVEDVRAKEAPPGDMQKAKLTRDTIIEVDDDDHDDGDDDQQIDNQQDDPGVRAGKEQGDKDGGPHGGMEEESTLEARVYYKSTFGRKNERRISVHLSGDEAVLTEPNKLAIMHPFVDGPVLGQISCYSLDEVLAEKLRAIAGQRKFAIARDIFDISEILRRGHAPDEALRIFPEKCKRKGLRVERGAYDRLLARKQDYASSWRGSLENLLPVHLRREGFEVAWVRAVNLLQRAL